MEEDDRIILLSNRGETVDEISPGVNVINILKPILLPFYISVFP